MSCCNISGLRRSAALEKHASILLEGSVKEYTETAIECQDDFKNITKEIIAIPDDGVSYAVNNLLYYFADIIINGNLPISHGFSRGLTKLSTVENAVVRTFGWSCQFI